MQCKLCEANIDQEDSTIFWETSIDCRPSTIEPSDLAGERLAKKSSFLDFFQRPSESSLEQPDSAKKSCLSDKSKRRKSAFERLKEVILLLPIGKDISNSFPTQNPFQGGHCYVHHDTTT